MIGIVAILSMPQAIGESQSASKKFLGMWTHTAKSFGVKDVYFVTQDKSIPVGDDELNIKLFYSMDEVRALGVLLVFVDQRGVPLDFFRHPDECLYVFGSDYSEGAIFKEGETAVSIECDHPYLYAHVAAGIVLHDRGLS